MLKDTYDSITESLAGTFSKLTFTPTEQVYDAAGKRVLPPDTVRTIVDKQIAASGNKMEKWGDELKAVKGQAGWSDAVDRWAVQFKEERRALELQCSSAGRGGLHSTTIEAFDRAEAVNKQQFKHIDEIVAKLKDDPDYVDSGRFENHGDAYARTARYSYETEMGESHKDAGFLWEVSWHHAINSCAECERLDGVWVPIGTNVEPGSRECGPGCDCTQEFARDNPDE